MTNYEARAVLFEKISILFTDAALPAGIISSYGDTTLQQTMQTGLFISEVFHQLMDEYDATSESR